MPTGQQTAAQPVPEFFHEKFVRCHLFGVIRDDILKVIRSSQAFEPWLYHQS
jgi:hypothetical protein